MYLGLNRPPPGMFRNLSNPQTIPQRTNSQGTTPTASSAQCPRQRSPSLNSSPDSSPSRNVSGRSEQASPAVAVGSGVATQRPVSFSSHSYSEYVPQGAFAIAYGQGIGNPFMYGRGPPELSHPGGMSFA